MSRTEPAGTPLGDAFHVYDTTLRNGAHREGISNSVPDKPAVARHLDALGVGFIEAGGPGALPKDTEFSARSAGSTRPVVGDLVTKLDMPVLPDGTFGELPRTSHASAEIADIAPDAHEAYVGTSAFAHKAGLHASAIKVDPELYDHMDPVVVGNGSRALVTETAGRAGVELEGARRRPGRPSRRGAVRTRGTAAVTRVRLESTDHSGSWTPPGPMNAVSR